MMKKRSGGHEQFIREPKIARPSHVIHRVRNMDSSLLAEHGALSQSSQQCQRQRDQLKREADRNP
jgi:hypothetical protein